jgi:hypothetical protein
MVPEPSYSRRVRVVRGYISHHIYYSNHYTTTTTTRVPLPPSPSKCYCYGYCYYSLYCALSTIMNSTIV